MQNISDVIEKHLMKLLEECDGIAEIQRSVLSDEFNCVPSQINYVISTRFTEDKGYVVESKRGGGGFIRIQRVKLPDVLTTGDHFFKKMQGRLSQIEAEGIIYQLEKGNHISNREAQVIYSAMSRDVLQIPLPQRDLLRARLLKAMLVALMR